MSRNPAIEAIVAVWHLSERGPEEERTQRRRELNSLLDEYALKLTHRHVTPDEILTALWDHRQEYDRQVQRGYVR